MGWGLQELVSLVLLMGSVPALSIGSSHREGCGNVLSPQSPINPCWLFLEGHPASLREGQRSLWGITTWISPFSLPTRMAAWGFSNQSCCSSVVFSPKSRWFRFHSPS